MASRPSWVTLCLYMAYVRHLFTLNRGVTPAVICGLACSDDGRLVAVSSAKGTAHVFHLPPFHGRHYRVRQLNVITRVRLGAVVVGLG